MDLTSGFYNVPLHEGHKKYTAFSSPFGLHEYNQMQQGLSNSPATFMRMMLSIFGDENLTSLLCYLDDLMVFGPTEQIALERLEMVFSRLKNHNLKLAPKKCHFLRRTVKFLGHVISGSGVQTDPGKVEAITQVQVSGLMDSDGVTPLRKKLRSFLGMVLYYQHFIEDCSTKARPLFKLLSEQKGRHFTAWSDNNPLTYILTKPRLDACEQRWVAKLAAYDFDLKYVPGCKNTVADALSREPFVKSSIGHRLSKEPYLSLLDEVNGVVTGTVQDAFRLTTNCQAVQTACDSADGDLSSVQDTCLLAGGTIGAEEVSAIIDAHCAGGVSRLSGANPSLLQLPEEDPSIVIPRSQLHNLQ
ncbi:hypothetical protein L3Q82_023711 [Scortum barcoo]|uniref:Uncharacterized protein n=1 Tax=Scortum barcoo TaxID=214431 RepID=A0ACB8WTM7_9TELE|nr:hypothetical protein L3Q82_023711 [Scortum barcoo]